MSNPRGTRFEGELLNGLRLHGLDVERLARAGAEDEGDLVIKGLFPGLHVVLEAKNEKRINLPEYLRQAGLEGEHYAAHRKLDLSSVASVAVVKRRGKGYLGAYVVTDVATILSVCGV